MRGGPITRRRRSRRGLPTSSRASARLAAIDRAGLEPNDQLNYDLYRDLLDTAVAGLGFHNDAMPIRGVIPHNLLMPMNQLEGVAQDIPRTISIDAGLDARRTTRTSCRGCRASRPLVDQTIALMEQGLAAGLTPPRITVRDVPQQVEAQVIDERDDPLKSPMLKPFTAFPASLAEPDRRALTARATAAYRDSVAPAFGRLRDFLVNPVSPGMPRDNRGERVAQRRRDVRSTTSSGTSRQTTRRRTYTKPALRR